MKIVISNEAKDDIISIYTYIHKDSPKFAKETIKNIRSKFDIIERFPYIGKKITEIENYREIIYKNYRIIYKIEKDDIIYINAIVHCKRNSKKIFNSI